MDTELVAIDRTDGNRLRAFQELSTRARGQTELHQVLSLWVSVSGMRLVHASCGLSLCATGFEFSYLRPGLGGCRSASRCACLCSTS